VWGGGGGGPNDCREKKQTAISYELKAGDKGEGEQEGERGGNWCWRERGRLQSRNEPERMKNEF